MFLLEAPYVSTFLTQTVERLGLAVLDTPSARLHAAGAPLAYLDESEFSRRLQAGERVYTNSENALDLIVTAAGDSDLARQIELCKDKALFRETIAPLYPTYRFMRVDPDHLDTLDVSAFPTPFVIKPARGFFSLGVHMVNTIAAWPGVVEAMDSERTAMNAEYPTSVVDSCEFIIEQGIEGEEYAIDVYYDNAGAPVITNILYHQFASEDDVSDRLYYTSAEIITTWLEPFTEAVTDIGRVCAFRDFPIHLEVRVDANGIIIPIEANPLRFAGWCVADITTHAWGFNPYEYYFNDLRPDWPAILKQRPGNVYAMVIGDIPSQRNRKKITHIDYDGFCDQFETVMELRKMDYVGYPLFAMAFVQTTTQNLGKLESILSADFDRFIIA